MTAASFEDLKQQGNGAFRSKNYSSAVAYYTEAIKVKDDEPVAYSNRAMCYIHLERYFEALEDCDKALEYDTKSVKAYYRRAKALSKLTRYQLAKRDFQLIVTLDPSNSSAKKEIEQLDKIIESDSRIDLQTYAKPDHLRSDKPLKHVELMNRYSGTFLYDQ